MKKWILIFWNPNLESRMSTWLIWSAREGTLINPPYISQNQLEFNLYQPKSTRVNYINQTLPISAKINQSKFTISTEPSSAKSTRVLEVINIYNQGWGSEICFPGSGSGSAEEEKSDPAPDPTFIEMKKNIYIFIHKFRIYSRIFLNENISSVSRRSLNLLILVYISRWK